MIFTSRLTAVATHIHVWLHSTGCSNGNWELVDSICLHQVFGDLANSTWLVQGVAVRVTAVGDHADFVFLQNRARGILHAYQEQGGEEGASLAGV